MIELAMMTNTKVFVVILNFNSGQQIVNCLSSVLQGQNSLVKILVVDNGSKDNSLEFISDQFPSVEIIKNEQNLGFAGGNNRGIKFALDNSAEYIFLLNPDTTINRNTVKNLLEIIESDKKIGIVGMKVYSMDNKIWSCGGEIDKKRFTGGLIGFGEKDHGLYDKEKEVDFISGAAMFVKREVFENIGPFPRDYFLYYEDVDFCLRAKKAGFKIYFTPHSIVYHDWSSIIGKKSPMKEYFMARNHFLFLEKYAPLRIKFRELLRLPKTIYEHYRKDEKFALLGIRDYFLRRFGNRDYWS